jgi:DNA-binding response OmpR family regulator
MEPSIAAPEQRDLPRILVVDHNKTNLGVLARRLSGAGYRAATADSGAAAVAELHRCPVDLVLAELYMPHMSGADLCRLLRREAQWRDIPIMLITGRSDPHGAVSAYEAGADDVILKPFHFEVLFARIARRLVRSRSVAALREANATLDARVVTRAIEVGELRDRLLASETERRRLEALVRADQTVAR